MGEDDPEVTKLCSLTRKVWDKLQHSCCGILFVRNWLKEFLVVDGEKSNPYKQVRQDKNISQTEFQQISQQEAR